MAIKTRQELKAVFVAEASLTEDDFEDIIYSGLHITEAGMEKSAATTSPLRIRPWGSEENLLDFGDGESGYKWRLNQKPDGVHAGLNITDPSNCSKLFIASDSGNIGVNTNTPDAVLQIDQGGDQDAFRMDISETGETPILIDKTGKVGINTVTPRAKLEINGTLQLNFGVAIDEFSDDPLLADNSDTSVPTENAVKTYTDARSDEKNDPQPSEIKPYFFCYHSNNGWSGISDHLITFSADEKIADPDGIFSGDIFTTPTDGFYFFKVSYCYLNPGLYVHHHYSEIKFLKENNLYSKIRSDPSGGMYYGRNSCSNSAIIELNKGQTVVISHYSPDTMWYEECNLLGFLIKPF